MIIFYRKLILSAFLLFPLLSLQAQLCTGSLGDPIVKYTFGTDTSVAGQVAQLPPGVTNYNYSGSDCPGDGSYVLNYLTSGCFGNTWYNLPEDHTPGDLYGYMMLVNASALPGDFYTQTVTGLCGGTTYEFAAWILNLNVPTACGGTPTKPNITFNIETTIGDTLKSYNTGNIGVTAVPTWRQYGTFFTTPANVNSVVIRMTNNAPGGCGNDIALDDITFRPCGPSVTASINGSSTTQNVCAGDVSSNTFTGSTSSGGPNTAYQWQISTDNGATWNDIPGATSTTYIPTVTAQGAYQYRLTVADAVGTAPSCRTSSNILFFNIANSPVAPAFISPDTVCISNQPVTFTDQPQNPAGTVVQWIWNFGDGSPILTAATNAPQPHTYAMSGTYPVTLQVKNTTGCSSIVFTKNIVVTDAPAIDFTYTNSCANNPVQFTSTSSISNAVYLWSFGDATTSTDANPIKTYSSGSSFSVSLQVTAFGCSSTVTKPVTLTAKPTIPSFTAPATGCVGQAITFTDQPTNPAGTITQWTWNFGDNTPVVNANTNATQPHTYTVAGTYAVTLQLNVNGCASNIFQQSITITNAPSVDFSFTGSCVMVPVSFISTTDAGAGAQYAWNFGDQATSTEASPIKTYNSGGTYNVTLLVTSAAGCSASIGHPVTIIPLLIAPVITTDSIGSDFLKFSWQPVAGAIAYKVSIDGTNFIDPSSGPAGTNHTITNLQPGQSVTLVVKAIGNNICENSSSSLTSTTKSPIVDIFIPNTFTPNGDGKNDILKIYGNNIKVVNMKIFNQWGELIFTSNNKDFGWDGTYKGKTQPVGVYVYGVEITTDDGKVINKKGTINLVK